jgi:pyruvate dehydrogenase E2 component (dihydrolipoamide acetyltransferase)
MIARHYVLMPQLGETVSQGTLARWLKAQGESVNVDEPLFEVESDKATMEIPAPASGTLAQILVGAGQTVDVGTRLAVILPSVPGAAPRSGDSA